MARGRKPQVLLKKLRDLTQADVTTIHAYVNKCNRTQGTAVSNYLQFDLKSLEFKMRYTKGEEIYVRKSSPQSDPETRVRSHVEAGIQMELRKEMRFAHYRV